MQKIVFYFELLLQFLSNNQLYSDDIRKQATKKTEKFFKDTEKFIFENVKQNMN